MMSGLSLGAFAGPQSVPTDSFIGRHVTSVSELHQQISLDPVVRRRLARHFHTSAPAVTRYIQTNLVLKKLSRAGTYKVYCISRTGREYTISQHLAAGTPVFVMRSTGQPVLKLACGNPMVAGLPPVATKVAAYHSPELAGVPAPGAAPIAPALESTGPVVVAMNDTPAVAVMPTTKVAGFLGQLPIVHGGGSPFGFLAAIPVLATVFGTHHGGGSNTPITGTTGIGTTGTGTTGTGTTGTGTTGTGTTGTGTTGTTGTGTTGTTGNTGTGTGGTTGTGTGETGTTGSTGTTGTGNNTLGTNTGGTGTNGNNTTGNNTGETTGTTGTGTGGTNTLGTTTGTNSGTIVTPVPEPSTPAAFAVGGMFLLFLLSGAKRRRSKTR